MCRSFIFARAPSVKARIGYQVHWNESSGWLWVTWWVLETEPMSSTRAASVQSCWNISPGPTFVIKKTSVFIVWIFFFIIQSLIHSFWLQPHWPMSLRCPCQLASMSVTSRRQQGKKREGLGVTFPVPSLFGCCVHSSCVYHSSVPLVPLSLQVEIVAASCCPGCLGTRWWSLHLQRVVIPQESHSLILWSLGLSVLSPSRSPASLDADPSTMV